MMSTKNVTPRKRAPIVPAGNHPVKVADADVLAAVTTKNVSLRVTFNYAEPAFATIRNAKGEDVARKLNQTWWITEAALEMTLGAVCELTGVSEEELPVFQYRTFTELAEKLAEFVKDNARGDIVITTKINDDGYPEFVRFVS